MVVTGHTQDIEILARHKALAYQLAADLVTDLQRQFFPPEVLTTTLPHGGHDTGDTIKRREA